MDATSRSHLEEQGYGGLDDETLNEVAPWLRLAPAVCSGIVLAATLTGSGLAMLFLVPVAVLAAVTARHPAEWIAERTVRRARRLVRPIPPAGPPRRFAYGVAAGWLVVAGTAFLAGWTTAGAVLGLAFSLATGMAAATDFCLACALWDRRRRAGGPGHRRGREPWPVVRLSEEDV